jgi:hypothetical protein
LPSRYHRSVTITSSPSIEISPAEANDALWDPARQVIDPTPASISGRSVRIIGWSEIARTVLTVIVVEHEGREYGPARFPLVPVEVEPVGSAQAGRERGVEDVELVPGLADLAGRSVVVWVSTSTAIAARTENLA